MPVGPEDDTGQLVVPSRLELARRVCVVVAVVVGLAVLVAAALVMSLLVEIRWGARGLGLKIEDFEL
jgi:hypothetical protein